MRWGGRVLEALPQTAVGSSRPQPRAPRTCTMGRGRAAGTGWGRPDGLVRRGPGLGAVCPDAECLSSSPRGRGYRRLRSGSPGPERARDLPAATRHSGLQPAPRAAHRAKARPRFPGQGAQGRHEDRAPERHLSAGQDRSPSRPAGHLPEGQQHPEHLHLPRGREGGCEAGPWRWGSPARRLGRARGHRPALRGPRGAGRSSAGDPECMGKGGWPQTGGAVATFCPAADPLPPTCHLGVGGQEKALSRPSVPGGAPRRCGFTLFRSHVCARVV